jgi:endo-1,4-beta-xylanase
MKFALATLLSASALVSAIPIEERQAQTINEAMIAKGKKYFGTCTDPGRLGSGSNSAVIKQHFGQITPENS